MTEEEQEAVRVLEGRRLAVDASMWQAPALTLVSQAFLLTVLTDGSVKLAVAIAVALAGIAALAVSSLSLWQQRNREKGMRTLIDDKAKVPSHPHGPGPQPPQMSTWAIWTFLVFPLFGVADVLALVLTRT